MVKVSRLQRNVKSIPRVQERFEVCENKRSKEVFGKKGSKQGRKVKG